MVTTRNCQIKHFKLVIENNLKLLYNTTDNYLSISYTQGGVDMEQMTCPVCGRLFDYDIVEYLDNGNPACPQCVDKERKEIEQAKTDN